MDIYTKLFLANFLSFVFIVWCGDLITVFIKNNTVSNAISLAWTFITAASVPVFIFYAFFYLI